MDYLSLFNLQNPWWRNPSSILDDEKIKNITDREKKVIFPLKFQENAIILGPRQVGKTTMIKYWILELIQNKSNPKNILYFSCEPIKEKNELIEIIQEFAELSKNIEGNKYVFLDEITHVFEWELAIKFILENRFQIQFQLIATGSNALLLKKGGDRLPGRNIIFKYMLPLSFRNFAIHFGSTELKTIIGSVKFQLSTDNLDKIWNSTQEFTPFLEELNSLLFMYLQTGGFLRAIYDYLDAGIIKEETREIYLRWILGDLAKNGMRELTFQSIIHGIVQNYGTKYSLNSISNKLQIGSHVTVSDYLDYLEGILLINNLYQVAIDKGTTALKKERKTYFIDPFLYSVFTGYSKGKFIDYSDQSSDVIIEGLICESIKRSMGLTFISGNPIWFYVGKKETDFVCRSDDIYIGFEVKWQNVVSAQDFNNSHLFKKRYLISKKTFRKEKEINIIPAAIFLAILSESTQMFIV